MHKVYFALAATTIATTTHLNRIAFLCIVAAIGCEEFEYQGAQTDKTAESRCECVDDVFHCTRFIFPDPDFPDQCQDLAPFLPDESGGGLLALHRACLSALLYKSMKAICFIRLGSTNVEPENMVSKSVKKKIQILGADDC